MWVGETEKNIKNLFAQAEAEKALIILDECDVLLRDRGKAMRSWEISQTEALLTCMEFHPYPFIMTTNLYDDLDPAVMRRILYKVKHDYLTDDQVKLAFKYFFDIEITERLNLSKLTSGDFAVVKKQAEFSGYLNNKDLLIEKLTEEMNQKKMLEHVPEIKM
jgi:SpoVK/Ycf46/Vps4 family AAA+-type ATPase